MKQVTVLVDIPQVFHKTYHLIFHKRILTQFQLLIPGTLPYLSCQACHPHSHMNCHWRSLSHLFRMFPVMVPVNIPQFLLFLSLLTCQWKSLTQIHIMDTETLPLPPPPPQVYHIMLIFPHLMIYPLQALHPEGFQNYHPQRIHLIKPALLLNQPQVCIYLHPLVCSQSLYHQNLVLYHLLFLFIYP